MKEHFLLLEEHFLSTYAVKSIQTLGRDIPLSPCPIRTEFQRDRDRIIHCKSFRRLKHKTQVFLSPEGDHIRTRLTHTLEVTQIARTIARALRLNEDLTEAIALGHDLGHTPFGHAGERVLANIVGHFEHNEQSLRVVKFLENDAIGLNLTKEVQDGILNHKQSGKPFTLEGVTVSLSDRIAYLNHDIDDAISFGILKESDIPKCISDVLGKSKGERINFLISDIIKNSYEKPNVLQSSDAQNAMCQLRDFMFDKLYFNDVAKKDETKATTLIMLLFEYYLKNIDEVPPYYKVHTDDKNIMVKDFIAGMTDSYAINIFSEKYVPKAFKL